ncbi:MAG: hypothetical protein MZV70_71680 [Desulfobacterales bacterium]|nr:hypothetical protein [Desulfobacterales bacterium]
MLVKRWGFGDEFCARRSRCTRGPTSPRRPSSVILVVHLANMLTRKMGLSSFEWDGQDLAEVPSAQLLGLSRSETLGRGRREGERDHQGRCAPLLSGWFFRQT